MTLPPEPDPETAAARAATVVAHYLALFTESAEQDPAVRGLAAARAYSELTRSPADTVKFQGSGDPVDDFLAEGVLTELFGDALVLADTRGVESNGLWEHLWTLYRSFARFQPAVGDLDAMSPEAVRDVCARLLADLLLCADRLQLISEDISTNGHLCYLDTFGDS
jgi:hypothetical protein